MTAVPVVVIPDAVAALKKALARLLPDVKSSHRVEALARGLGWGTNATMRADLGGGAVATRVDDAAFCAYLSAHGFTVPPDSLTRAVALATKPPDCVCCGGSGYERVDTGHGNQEVIDCHLCVAARNLSH